MQIEFDPAKNARNIELRGLSLERVAEFDFATAVFAVDARRDYGEIRMAECMRWCSWKSSKVSASSASVRPTSAR